MKAAAFAYERPDTLERALALLAEGAGEARPIAGGQSLGPMLSLRLARPKLLIDLGAIARLKRAEDLGGRLFIGAMNTHASIEDGRVADPCGGMLGYVAADIAHRGVRNRGTIGGSLAHADPAADWPSALVALGAQISIASPRGARVVAVDAFLRSAFATALDLGEIVEGVVVPRLGAQARWGWAKITHKAGHFSDAIGAVVADPESKHCRVVMGAVGGAPIVLSELSGRLARDARAPARAAIAAEVSAHAPHLDAAARHLHTVAVERAFHMAYPR